MTVIARGFIPPFSLIIIVPERLPTLELQTNNIVMANKSGLGKMS